MYEIWFLTAPFHRVLCNSDEGYRGRKANTKGRNHLLIFFIFRQPKSLTLAFGQGAITHLTPIFYNFALKAKSAWDSMIDASGGDSAVIEDAEFVHITVTQS